jgi:hypothetical protein
MACRVFVFAWIQYIDPAADAAADGVCPMWKHLLLWKVSLISTPNAAAAAAAAAGQPG